MKGTTPTRNPSGNPLEEPFANIAVTAMFVGVAIIGGSMAAGVGIKNTVNRALQRIGSKLPLGPP